MRQNPQISALLRQVRAWQKAIFQISFESGSSAPDSATRHLILILFVLRIQEQRHQGFSSGSTLSDGLLRLDQSLWISSLAQLQQSHSPCEKLQSNQLYLRLVELWRSLQPQFQRLPVAFALDPNLPLPDRLLRSMISQLYPSERQLDKRQLDKRQSKPGVLFCSSLLGQVYETLLKHSPKEIPFHSPARSSQRKSQGIYYTPEPIVQFMVQQTIDKLLECSKEFDRVPTGHHLPRLLDPACGGGVFLLEAYQALLDWQLQQLIDRYPQGHDFLVRGLFGEWQLCWAMRQQILQHCIYGVDIDPEAVTVAQLSLWLKLLEGSIASDAQSSNPQLRNAQLPDLSANLRIGNALLGEDAIVPQPTVIGQTIIAEQPTTAEQTAAETAKLDREIQPIDWEKAFPVVMRSGGFDGVIGNPPYLDSEQMTLSCPTWRTYCATRYITAIGNWDLFCVFIEKALMLCRSGGVTSLIVPNKLASAPYAAQARSLLMQHRLLLIRDYAQVSVFGAAVYPLVYVVQKESVQKELVQKESPPFIQVRYEVMEDLAQVQRSGWLSHTAESPDACWKFAESAVHARLMQRLQQLPTLGSIAQVFGAATVAEAYGLKPWLQECDTPTPKDFRFVNSGTIDRYTLRWGKKPTRYLGEIYQHPILSSDRLHHLSARRQQQARQPKIIVAGLSQQLECVLDSTGNLLAGKSTCIVLGIPESLDWQYLLALLNSRLLTAYLHHCAGGNRLQSGYLRVGPAQLKQLPIYLPNFSQSIDRRIYAEIIALVQQGISKRSRNELDNFENFHLKIDPQIDQKIADLYRLTDEEVASITHTHFQRGQ
jgi:hypothetical protein